MTIDDLKIDPKFRDLIPKLTDAEYKQLEENILADGRVKEPIIVWGNTIVDGHHRYYILKDHPEIPYEIEQKEFANEHAAMAWACANQLGRRNLTKEDSSYLRAEMYDQTKLSRGGKRGNQYEKVANDENNNLPNSRTIDKVAEQLHVSPDTISHDERFKKGVDAAETIAPGLKDEIMHGEKKVPKYIIEEISKVTPDKQRKAVEAISNGDIQKAKDVLEQKKETLKKYGLNDDGEDVSFTIDDLTEEIIENFSKCMESLETTISSHMDVINDESLEHLAEKLRRMLDLKIKEITEGL